MPTDELQPLSCTGRDTWGGYSLTLVDSLDTLLIMGNHTEFEKQVMNLPNVLHFDKDVNVSLFETNIRMLGGLLSAHLLITLHGEVAGLSRSFIESYDGSLLRLAVDLADRLLVAFNTPTGMPYGTVRYSDDFIYLFF